MTMQSQFVQALEERAGLDEATAERVAEVAIDFSKAHASELMSEQGTESVTVVTHETGAIWESTPEGPEEAAAEQHDPEKHGGFGSLFSRLTGH